MAKKKAGTSGKQMDLIDVQPENAKPIIEAAKLYMEYQAERLGFLAKEVEQKKKIIILVEAANMQPLKDGKIKFEIDGFTISIEPQGKLVKVKEKKIEAEAE